MKEARNLLLLLDVNYATIRHVQIVADFLNRGETDAKVLLDNLGTWDDNDLFIVEKFLKERQK